MASLNVEVCRRKNQPEHKYLEKKHTCSGINEKIFVTYWNIMNQCYDIES